MPYAEKYIEKAKREASELICFKMTKIYSVMYNYEFVSSVVYDEVSKKYICECNNEVDTGLPCLHVIAVGTKYGNFNIDDYISPIWLTENYINAFETSTYYNDTSTNDNESIFCKE